MLRHRNKFAPQRAPSRLACCAAMAPREYTTLEICGLELKLSSPSKVYFPAHAG